MAAMQLVLDTAAGLLSSAPITDHDHATAARGLPAPMIQGNYESLHDRHVMLPPLSLWRSPRYPPRYYPCHDP